MTLEAERPKIRKAPRRGTATALCAAVAAAATTVAIGAWLTNDTPEYDGDVRLDTPGIFQEPLDEGNDDVIGTAMPAVSLRDTAGNTRTLDEFRGSPLIVNLWFVNCPPCARELAEFAEVDAQLAAARSDVKIVGIDAFDKAEPMLEFARARGVQYELWRDTERDLGVELGVVAYPVTLYIDAAGNIVHQTGETDAAEIRNNVTRMFGERFDG